MCTVRKGKMRRHAWQRLAATPRPSTWTTPPVVKSSARLEGEKSRLEARKGGRTESGRNRPHIARIRMKNGATGSTCCSGVDVRGRELVLPGYVSETPAFVPIGPSDFAPGFPTPPMEP